MTVLYRRGRGVRARKVSGSLFLAHPSRGDLYRANVTVAAAWHALARPLTEAGLVALFRAAYPRVGVAKLRRELRRMLADLVAAGLVEERPSTARRR